MLWVLTSTCLPKVGKETLEQSVKVERTNDIIVLVFPLFAVNKQMAAGDYMGQIIQERSK